jgi:PAS domain S-box-containing protein
VIRVAVGPQLANPPFVLRDERGAWTGFCIELLKDSARAVGSRVELVEPPEGLDVIQALSKGHADIAPLIFVGGDATPALLAGAPMLHISPGVWCRAGSGPPPSNPDQLSSYRLGVQVGSASERWLRSTGVEPAVRRASRVELANDLLEGRVDLIVAAHSTMAPHLTRYSDRSRFTYGKLSASGPMGSVTFGAVPRSADHAFWLSQGLSLVGASGRYFDLYEQFLKDPTADGEQAVASEAVFLRPMTSRGRTAGRPLRIAVEDRGRSFSRLVDRGERGDTPARGFSVDLAEALARAMQRERTITVLDAPAATDAVARGEVDAVVVTDLDDLETRRIEYSRPVVTMHGAVFTRPGTPPPATIERLHAMRVGVTWGSRAHQYVIQSQHPRARLLANWQTLFAQLDSGEIDAVIGLAPPIRSLQRERLIATPIQEHALPGEGFASYEVVAVRAGNNLLLWDVQDALAAMEASGELARIYARWLGDVAPRPMTPTFPVRSVVIGALVAAALLLAVGTGWALARRTLARRSQQLAQAELAVSMVSRALPVLVHSYTVANDGARRTLYVSDNLGRYQQIFEGYSLDRPYEETIGKLLHPDDAAEYVLRATRSRSTGEPFDFTFRLRDRDGRYHWLRSTVIGERHATGRTWHAVCAEVTEHQEALIRATTSEARFRAIVELAPHAAVQFYDQDARVVSWNDASTRLYGWSAAEAVGRRIGELMLDEEGQRFFLEETRRLATGAPPKPPSELPFRSKDGRTGWLLSSIFLLPRHDADKQSIFACMDIDVTGQHQQRLDSERLRGKLADALEASSTGTWSVDIASDTVVADQHVIALFGLNGVALPGRPTPNTAFFSNVIPEDLPVIERAWNAALSGDGTYACQFRTSVNGVERWVNGRGRVVRDARGRAVQMIGVSVDITELKLAERRQRELLIATEQAKRLESLGLLAGGIAHDFNNLLAAVLGNAALVQQSVPQGSAPHQQLDQLQNAARFASELTQQLLTYAGRRTPTLTSIDLGEVIGQTVPLVRSVTSAGVHLSVEAEPRVPHVHADRVQLRQVVLNLLLNAVEAASTAHHAADAQPPAVRVQTRVVHLGSSTKFAITPQEPLPTGDYAAIDVTDNGRGIDPAVVERIFEPFYTTKFAGRGLGLAIVREIVRSLAGAIEVRPAPQGGTTFTVFLPLAPATTPRTTDPLNANQTNGAAAYSGFNGSPIASAPPPVAPSASPPLPLEGRCVLVIDDETLVREVVTSALTAAGALVHSAGDAHEAVGLLRRHLHERGLAPPSCAVVDLVMPSVDGIETVELIRKLAPGLPVVICSGYAGQTIADEVRTLPRSAFLQKPFVIPELIETVRRLASS